MAAMGGHRSVSFDVQSPGAYAVQLRLTPALLEALLRAQETGSGASMRFGTTPQGNAITVGGTDFRFNALPEETCDLLCLSAGGGADGGEPAIVGAVRQKLQVMRNIQDERERVRARAEEAERRGHERKAQLLHSKPAGGGKAAAIEHRTVHRSTPPPTLPPTQPHAHAQGPPRQQQPLTASMLAAPTGRPPAHPATGPRARSLTPPPSSAPAAPGLASVPPAAGSAAPPSGPAPAGTAGTGAAAAGSKPVHKSASAGKLGLGGAAKHGSAANLAGGAGTSAPLTASPFVLAAARTGSLRLCLIALLSERSLAMKGIRDVLADASARVRSFKKPSKEELERTVKAVSEFKFPGKYVVYPMLLRELAEADLVPAGSSEQQPQHPGRSSSPQETSDGGPAGTGAARSEEAGAAGPGGGGGGRGRLKKAGGGGDGVAAARKGAAGGKRSRFDWSEDDSSDAEQQPPPPQRPRQQQQAAAAAPVPAPATSPPSVDGRRGGGGGSSSSGGGGGSGPQGKRKGAGLQRRTSSSRGSDHADESWIEEHADRQPEPAAPITTKEEYRAREAAFNQKYRQYFDLHQLIEAHKKDCEAVHKLAVEAPTDTERQQHLAELERLHQRRGERAKKWDAAYRVLHEELSAAKSRMAEFVQQLQQQQQQAHGVAPGALPAVRVK